MSRTIRITGARRIDPTQPDCGSVADLRIRDGRIVDAVSPPAAAVEQRVDMSGCIMMAGGIDLHTHIGGGKVNLARLLLTDELREPLWTESMRREQAGHTLQAWQQHGDLRGPIWSTQATGHLYSEMGYTTCFEPAMLLPQARSTHMQLIDTPLIDSGAYVVMGNEDWLVRALARGESAEVIRDLVAWTVNASRAYAVKVVNAGGIHAFKFGTRSLNVDEPHARYGVTPRQFLRSLSAAVDELGLSHPLHVHASNLGMPGNVRALLDTINAVEGRRLHLTHVQFNAYTDDGPFGMGSGAALVAERVNRSPELSIDVGQVVFGRTVTISADVAAQSRNSRHASPKKSYLADIEACGGCGVVPMRYENSHYVASLQWTIGLELLLLIRNPYQVFLTTDHPNGGPFTSYPHLMRLLMDKSFRAAALDTIHPAARERSLLAGLDREYSLEEIAVLTRAAPARILGLKDRGHLRPGGKADVVFYRPAADWERTFQQAESVWKSGVEVMRKGRLCGDVTTTDRLTAGDLEDRKLDARMRAAIEQTLQLPIETLEISEAELPAYAECASIPAPRSTLCPRGTR